MKKSRNEKVQKLLADLELSDAEKYEIVQAARDAIFSTHPSVTERVMYGGIMFTLAEDWGGLFVSKQHVSFEFSNGYQLKDPNQALEGTGKFRRHLKLRSVSDVEEKTLAAFLEQIG